MTYLVTVAEIATMLAERIEALCAELLPHGRREGHEWVEAATAKGGLGDSLKVSWAPGKRGVWSHFAGGPAAKGDALDLVGYLLTGGDKHRAITWAKSWLGLDTTDRATLEKRRAQSGKDAAAARAEGERRERARRADAYKIFSATRADISTTPVWDYLGQRGIDMSVLGRDPGALRYHPGLKDLDGGGPWPAMVAIVAGADGKFAGIHRTWLHVPVGGGPVTKAPITTAKATLGPSKGGCIRLWSGTPKQKFSEWTGTVAISEGIEDGLSYAVADPSSHVVCAVSLSKIAALVLPPAVREVIILAQNDEKPAAIAALDAAQRALLDRGLVVRAPKPPAGIKDWNDLLRRGAPNLPAQPMETA